MVNPIEQKEKVLERIRREIEAAFQCKNIREISEYTGISKSTVQRDLSKKDLVVSLTSEEFYENLQQWIQLARSMGNFDGGKNSQEIYGYGKDKNGHFIGKRR